MLGAKHVSVPNHLLGALPRKDYQKLLPFLEPVKLVFGEILYESHAQIRHVYFPIDSFVSMLTTVDAGRAAEVGLIGSEGMIGVPMALGVAVSPFRAVVQGGGALPAPHRCVGPAVRRPRHFGGRSAISCTQM